MQRESYDGRGDGYYSDDVYSRPRRRAKAKVETQVDKTFVGMLRSRKFLLAASIIMISTVALFIKYVSGGEWVAITGIVMGAYSAANVMQRRYMRPAIPQYDETDMLED